jgi:alpha-D-ribose 1-methylphosphonate 5-triphosphate synthase subunit PhnH
MKSLKDEDTNVLGLELMKARRWLWMMYHSGEPVVGERKAQCEFTLTWVQLQQKVLDNLEKWDEESTTYDLRLTN